MKVENNIIVVDDNTPKEILEKIVGHTVTINVDNHVIKSKAILLDNPDEINQIIENLAKENISQDNCENTINIEEKSKVNNKSNRKPKSESAAGK